MRCAIFWRCATPSRSARRRAVPYGVSVGASLGKVPYPRYTMQVFFETDADKLDELLPIVQQEIDDIVSGNITDEELTRTREFFVKRYRDGLIHKLHVARLPLELVSERQRPLRRLREYHPFAEYGVDPGRSGRGLCSRQCGDGHPEPE